MKQNLRTSNMFKKILRWVLTDHRSTLLDLQKLLWEDILPSSLEHESSLKRTSSVSISEEIWEHVSHRTMFLLTACKLVAPMQGLEHCPLVFSDETFTPCAASYLHCNVLEKPNINSQTRESFSHLSSASVPVKSIFFSSRLTSNRVSKEIQLSLE